MEVSASSYAIGSIPLMVCDELKILTTISFEYCIKEFKNVEVQILSQL
jgi:hypothetical protein